ncbi:ABC transporter ATP-binding protein [Aliicoccus persicus]|uniref:ATP-binding cassette, subfamily B n=1 Tax=Aliicoccus persicus TaxID=930138 RepID=A0A662Z2B9_9STAP|nr:ABC transporter ATP-binding protein [Aliicoccus persicus]SEV94247.1 ATP-binding cassette, subfamily B [Aliicoccus persicus]
MTEIKRLFRYVIPYKWWFILGISLMIIAVAAELLGPVVIMTILDDYISLGEGRVLLEPIIQLLIIYAVIKVVHAIVAYATQIVLQNTGARVVQGMRHEVFEHIQRLPIRYFDNLPAGKVVARITNDTETILQFFTVVLPTLLVSGLTMIAITIAVFYINVFSGVVMLLAVPLVIVWMILYRKYSNDFNHTKRERNSDMNAMINESINGMPIIQVFNREKQIYDEFGEINEEYTKSATNLVKLNSLTGHNLASTLMSLVFAMMVLVFSMMYLSPTQALSVGIMYLLVDYVTRFFNPLFDLVNQLEVFEQARVAAVKVFEMIDEEEEPVETGELTDFDGRIVFDNVEFSYDGENTVLQNINMSVGQGETVALVGHTGSGKSSIINLLLRFYDPTSGEILFSDSNSREINKKNLRSYMSIVLQDPFIYAGTLLHNVRLNNTDISEEQAKQALIDVGGKDLLNRMEEGMDTYIPERGATLSLGERQLISFARALAFDPKVLVLDEATSNVDSETEQIIQHAMKVVSDSRTTFIIAHRLSTIQHADQIVLLEKGIIKEQGNHQTLMALGKDYRKMYDMQVVKG